MEKGRRRYKSLLWPAIMLLASSYGSAQGASYPDAPLSRLQAAVPKLRGLRPDSNQERLPFILTKVGQSMEDLLRRLPNVACREQACRLNMLPPRFLMKKHCGDRIPENLTI